MINTVLLDLDDTLLGNDMQQFIPLYLNKFEEYMSDIVSSEHFTAELLKGTQAMITNMDPTITNEQAFANNFYPALEVSEEELRNRIDEFYSTVFPSLQTITTYRPEAELLVRHAFETGAEVVIATSPIFTRSAIEQRLSWAGVPVHRYDYALVTSYEDFHFTKPHLSYYTEILGLLGKPLHEAAMIGNNPADDLEPARTLGMAVFHISSSPLDEYPGGSLTDAISWLDQASSQTQPEASNLSGVLLARQRGYLAALIGMTKDLDPQTWTRRSKVDEWAPTEIVCHLRDVELEVTLPRVSTILSETNPHLSSFDTDRWAEERDYIHQSGPEALATFTQARMQTIARLDALNPEDWSRTATHSLFGPTTFTEIVSIATDHDQLHLSQLRSTLATWDA
jgi:FMN phosphatase YigB (HAD superfamily)